MSDSKLTAKEVRAQIVLKHVQDVRDKATKHTYADAEKGKKDLTILSGMERVLISDKVNDITDQMFEQFTDLCSVILLQISLEKANYIKSKSK